MGLFEIMAVLLTLSAVFSFINYRFIGMPNTIGLMFIGLLFSLLLLAAGTVIPGVGAWAVSLLDRVDFSETLLHGMLSFLLFAGSLHVNINDLQDQYRVIGSLATFGVAVSTFLVGTIIWWVLAEIGQPMPYIYCLLFGALISPTDPIAVLGIMKTAGAPKCLETQIAGESLFNDGVGLVFFLVLLGIATGGHEVSAAHVAHLFVQESVGGVVFGLATGYFTYLLLRRVDNYQVEVLLTLALVTGGYALAEALHLSAPIAIVVAGLFIGNHGRRLAMSEKTLDRLDTFWELTDEILNAVLFVLIGLEVMVLSISAPKLAAGLIAIPVVLLARFISVSIPVSYLKRFSSFSAHVVKIMTWSGLRGGISVALALSLPSGPHRDTILVITYTVVVFSILVQGLTVERLMGRLGVGGSKS